MASAEKEGGGDGGAKKWVIIIGVVVLLSNGVWGAMYFTSQKPSEGEAEAAEPAPGKEAGPGPIMTLEPMTVNLADLGGKRYLQLEVSLELRSEEDRELVESRRVPLRDAYLSVLSGLETVDLIEKDDKARLRKELLLRTQEMVSERAVTHVYFTKFIMQ